jgi:hypothetical protein
MTSTEFPAPIRHAGRLVWDRHGIENYKRALIGLPPLGRDPEAPIKLVTAKQLADELPFGRRTLGRRVRGRVQAEPHLATATETPAA